MTNLPEGRNLVQSFVFRVVGTVLQNPFARQLVKVTHRVLVSCGLVNCTPRSARQWFQHALSTYLGLLHDVSRFWIQQTWFQRQQNFYLNQSQDIWKILLLVYCAKIKCSNLALWLALGHPSPHWWKNWETHLVIYNESVNIKINSVKMFRIETTS